MCYFVNGLDVLECDSPSPLKVEKPYLGLFMHINVILSYIIASLANCVKIDLI